MPESPVCQGFRGSKKIQKNLLFRACFSEKAVPDRQKKPRKKNAGKREKKKALETQADQGLCPDRAVPFFHIGRKKKSPGTIPADRIWNAGRQASTDGRQERHATPTAGRTAGRTARKAGTPTAGRHASRAVPIRPDRQDGRTEKSPDGRTRGRNAPRARLMEGTQKAVSR